jgi:hypothetical protein
MTTTSACSTRRPTPDVAPGRRRQPDITARVVGGMQPDQKPPDQQPHRAAARRLPRRSTDWVEGVASAVLIALGVLAGCAAPLVGLHTDATITQQARLDAAQHDRVAAVLIRDVALIPAPEGRGPSPAALTPARWVGRDGLEHTGVIPVRDPLQAGQRVTAWVDHDNRVVPAPTSDTDAFVLAFGVGLAVASTAAATLLLLWYVLASVIMARNYARWAREWEHIEPRWSGRTN